MLPCLRLQGMTSRLSMLVGPLVGTYASLFGKGNVRTFSQRVKFIPELPSHKEVMQSLVTSCKREIERVKEDEEFSVHADFGTRFLKEGRFKLAMGENEDEAFLTKTEGNQHIEVKFPVEMDEELDEDEDFEEDADDAYDEEAQDAEEVGEHDHDFEAEHEQRHQPHKKASNKGSKDVPATRNNANQVAAEQEGEFIVEGTGEDGKIEVKGGEHLEEPLPSHVPLTVTITFKDRADKESGRLVFACEVNKDNRLYVEAMDVVPMQGGQESAKSLHAEFRRFSPTMQDTVYDYLDVIGVDDRLAHFARQYVVRVKRQRDTDFFSTLHSVITANTPKK